MNSQPPKYQAPKYEPQYRVLEAEFLLSAYDVGQLPREPLPEIAVLGRSNVGKSSLLNAITERKGLARTSNTPGRTQAINLFKIGFQTIGEKTIVPAYISDLPGFGYAKVPKELRLQWQQLLPRYLQIRDNLRAVILLLDCRREIGAEEHEIADLGRDGGLIVVLTKADKEPRAKLKTKLAACARELSVPQEAIIITSTLTGSRQGIDELRDVVCSCLDDGTRPKE